LEELDEGAGEEGDRIGRSICPGGGRDRSGSEQADAGLELVAPGSTAIAPPIDQDPAAPCGADRCASAALHLDQGGGERRQGGVGCAGGHGTIPAQADMVERPLAQPAEPAVEGAVAERREGRRRAPQPLTATRVAAFRRRHDRQAVRLAGQQIGREQPEPAAA
jgi:hypothetical protein